MANPPFEATSPVRLDLTNHQRPERTARSWVQGTQPAGSGRTAPAARPTCDPAGARMGQGYPRQVMRATVCAGIVLVAAAACGDDSAEAEDHVRDGCQRLVDIPTDDPAGWGEASDKAGIAFHKAADLDSTWHGMAAAQDNVRNLPSDSPPGKLLAQIDEWLGTVTDGCEDVKVNTNLFELPPLSERVGR